MPNYPNYISWENGGWLNLGETVTSFAGSGMPDKVHFSISHHPESEYINFHVTKNHSSQTDKPKIEIIRVKKEDADELFQVIINAFLQMALQPFDMRTLQNRRSATARNARFLSFKQYQQSIEIAILKRGIISTYRQHSSSTRRNRRIKMHATIEKGFSELAKTVPIHNVLIDQFKRVPRQFKRSQDIGCVISTSYTGARNMFLRGQWYTFPKGF